MSENETMPGVFIETYGCQMNVLDSELVRDQLVALGYHFVERPQQADVVLLNTCSVRDLSEQKVWSQLGRLGISKREHRPDLVIGILGCMAEREGEQIIKRMSHVDLLCGPSNLDELPMLVEGALKKRGHQVSLAGHQSRRSATLDLAKDRLEALDLSRSFSPTDSPAQAYVRITRGCNKFCSFCVVPFTRGPEVHRAPEHILTEIRRLVDHGVLEVTLLGQTVNHYSHHDGGKSTSFADLLMLIHEEIPDLARLRFITSYPRDFSDDALDAMAACPRICRYLHIPAQSGSNTILKAMNRGYSVEEYGSLLERARARMPDIRLAGDMIVGFPGESEQDHQASIDLLRRAQYKSCFIFKYSPRTGTVAHRRYEEQVPEETKKRRNQDLLKVQGQISHDLLNDHTGHTLEVLVEDFGKFKTSPNANESNLVQLGSGLASKAWRQLRGRTTGDEIVVFDGPANLLGSLTQVKAQRATSLTIHGTWLAPASAKNQKPSVHKSGVEACL
jgi:tRNA-2-methylthio-N6-dimethylallyladenosine synthase